VKGKRWLVLLLVFCFLVMAGCGSSQTGTKSKVIGTVNGDEITQAEFDTHYKIAQLYYDQQMQQITGNGQNQIPGAKISGAKTQAVLDNLKKQAWDDVVLQKIILQQAPKEGIEVSNKEVDQVTRSEDYKKFIQENNLDSDAYREALEAQYVYNDLQKKATARVEVSDKEIEEYYKAHLSEYKSQGGVEISHILVKTEQQAKDILAQLNAGADFAALAKKYSDDTGSKEQGGYVGLANKDSGWVDEFQAVAMKLKPGEMTQVPVKTKFGYHIIKAGAKKDESTRSLQDAHNEISMKLQEQKEKDAFTKYLADLKKKATIQDLRPQTKSETTKQTK